MKIHQPISSDFIDITLPTSWEMMTPENIETWAHMACQLPASRAKICFLLDRLAEQGFDISQEGFVFHRFNTDNVAFIVTDELAVALETLDFLDIPPLQALHIEKIGTYTLLSNDLQGVPFESYLIAENCFQAFLQSQEQTPLVALLNALCLDDVTGSLSPIEQYITLLWYASIKAQFGAMFPDLFKPSSSAEPPTAEDMRQAMDAQIRALTGGDITKEQLILSADTWRALTELNAKAREANEYKSNRV